MTDKEKDLEWRYVDMKDAIKILEAKMSRDKEMLNYMYSKLRGIIKRVRIERDSKKIGAGEEKKARRIREIRDGIWSQED